MNGPLLLIVLGICVGIYSGVMGLGGGTLMIPVMVLALGFSQIRANATSLAVMLPPVMLPALLRFYREGKVDLRVAAWIALGVVLGSFAGAVIAEKIDAINQNALKMVFGFVLMYVAGYTVFSTAGPHHLSRSMLLAGLFAAIGCGMYWAIRLFDQRGAV